MESLLLGSHIYLVSFEVSFHLADLAFHLRLHRAGHLILVLPLPATILLETVLHITSQGRFRSFNSFFLKISKVVLGFRNFGYDLGEMFEGDYADT